MRTKCLWCGEEIDTNDLLYPGIEVNSKEYVCTPKYIGNGGGFQQWTDCLGHYKCLLKQLK